MTRDVIALRRLPTAAVSTYAYVNWLRQPRHRRRAGHPAPQRAPGPDDRARRSHSARLSSAAAPAPISYGRVTRLGFTYWIA